jgi:hypothetical protein
MSVLVVLLGAALIVSVGFAERADSKRFSPKVLKSLNKKRLAGAYSGVTEQGNAVSFRLARSGKLVDFVMPITLNCEKDVGDLNGDGTYTFDGGEIVYTTKSVTLRSAPVPGRKADASYPLGMTFEYESPQVPADQPPPGTEVQEYSIKVKFKEELLNGSNVFRPIPKRAAAMHGEVAMGTRNGPLNGHAPGRERCATVSVLPGLEGHPSLPDFDVKKTGR